jgi:hypothetical protein
MSSTIVQDLVREQLAELEEIKTEYLEIGKIRQAAVVSERMEEIYNEYLAADTVEKSGPEPKAGEGNTGVIVRVSPRNKAVVVRLSDGRLTKVRAQDLRFVRGEARRSKQTGKQPKTRGQ